MTLSASWIQRARARTPEGSHTISKAPARFVEGASPAFAARACGPYLYDVDGNEFIDWIGGLGVLTLGSAHPAIVEAVQRQLCDGSIFSIPHILECQVGERLCSVIPCARGGMVRWTKTGSEACAGAIRVARIATGRSIVVVASPGYHGWHDWFSITQPYHAGIPEDLRRNIVTFKYGDLESFEAAIATAGPQHVAAVFTEPARDTPPDGFLSYLRHRTFEIGALLVFDELRLGFRLAVAGGQEFFGVTPDLATFGKSLGGGLPLAALLGPAAIMKHAAFMSGTFNGDCLALAAASAVLEIYAQEPVIERVWRAGSAFVDAFDANSEGLPVQCGGLKVNPLLAWDDPTEVLKSLFVQEMARDHVLVHTEALYPSAALADRELQQTRVALARGLGVLRESLAERSVRSRLDGRPCRIPFTAGHCQVDEDRA